ncbi:hypothetical protein OHR68_32785 [Spirillospora sp. NBC_00431]
MVVGEFPHDGPNDTLVLMGRHGRQPLPVTAQSAEDFTVSGTKRSGRSRRRASAVPRCA